MTVQRAVRATPDPFGAVDSEIVLTPADRAAMREQWLTIESLYRDEAPHLARYFERRVARDDVLDMVQESFRRILGHRPDHPGSFLGRTAANLVHEFRRVAARRHARSHERFDERHAPAVDPVPQLEARDALARLQIALGQLKPKTRNIFLMSRIEGMTYAEIAEAYGMSEEGVKKQVATAMNQVRRRIGDL
ncbi:MAG: sigma-70 family RNA polymerase sigma factor [Pseudomonadota bacterium]